MCKDAREQREPAGPGGREEGGASAAGPGGALERLRRQVEEREERRRIRVREAALEVAGEVGWRRASVEAIITRAGISRGRFYKLFADRGQCLAEAHRAAATRLVDEVLDDLAAAPDRRAGLRLALDRLAALTEERPLLARGLLAEARLGGTAVSLSREKAFERLSGAVPGARRETAEPRHSPPPSTAPFILSAVYSAVLDATASVAPTPLRERLDALTELACLACGAPGAAAPTPPRCSLWR